MIGVDKNLDILNYIRQDKNYGKVKALADVGNKFKSREFNGIKIYKKNELSYLVVKFNINEIIIGKGLPKKEIAKNFDKFEQKNIRIKNLSNKINSTGFVDQISLDNLDFFNVINRPKINVKKEILLKNL